MQRKEWAEILPLGNGGTAEDDRSLMVPVTLGKMEKEEELELMISFRKGRDLLICRAIICF